MEKWEYKSFKVGTGGFAGGIVDIEDFDRELNQLGEQGWELVSCISTNMGQGATRDLVATLKRIKPSSF